MKLMNRRSNLGLILAGFATVIGADRAKGQYTEQNVRNGLQVTSTGNVTVDQAASGQQGVYIDGTLQTRDGVYRTSTGQVVMNNGQITSTGDVTVSQSASGNQQVVATLPQNDGYYDGMPANQCQVGSVIADPNGVLYFQKDDCCFYRVPCIPCKKKGCEGDYCGS
jgi:hypothetical protein